MRALLFACLLCLCGCAGFTDPSRVDSMTRLPLGRFVYRVHTNTVMLPNDDGASERIRREWLAETLGFNRMCPQGYVVDSRSYIVDAVGPFGNGGNIVYAGHCLRGSEPSISSFETPHPPLPAVAGVGTLSRSEGGPARGAGG
jgi:hypothetical protein